MVGTSPARVRTAGASRRARPEERIAIALPDEDAGESAEHVRDDVCHDENPEKAHAGAEQLVEEPRLSRPHLLLCPVHFPEPLQKQFGLDHHPQPDEHHGDPEQNAINIGHNEIKYNKKSSGNPEDFLVRTRGLEPPPYC